MRFWFLRALHSEKDKIPSNEACMFIRKKASAFIFHVVTVCLDDVTFEVYLFIPEMSR